MSVTEMRRVLVNNTKYSGSATWTRKVASMHDRQVVAVYNRLLSAGQISKNENRCYDGSQLLSLIHI